MEFGSTDRTQRLKTNLVSKACYNGKYDKGIYVDVERPALLMKSYKTTEGEDSLYRRAKGLRYVLENIPISILDDELIIGNPHANTHALPIFPEVNPDLLEQALADGYVKETDRELAKELIDYWTPRSIKVKVEEVLDDWQKEIIDEASSIISITHKDGIQHCIPNWEYLFSNGFNKIKKRIEEKADQIKADLNNKNDLDFRALVYHYDLCKAMLISLDGVRAFVTRYANLAREKAVKETNSQRKRELENIAQIMDRIFLEPPTSFQEAVQIIYFMHLIFNCIDSAAFGSMIRIDQTLWDSYKKEVLETKTLSSEEAQELIECLILKVEALGAFFSRRRRLHFEGNGALPIWSIGGIKNDDSDASNELTETILRAARSIHCNQPTISIMYHPNISDGALTEAILTIKSGLGYPSITNTKWMVDSLVRQGIPLDVAKNSGVVGCVSCCPMDANNTTKRLALTILAAKCLELALNEGKCQLTGKQLGLKTKKPTEFVSFNEIIEAFREQISFAVRTAINNRNITRYFEGKYRPNPLASALHKSPLEIGKDTVTYEDYPVNYWANMVGLINVANSLIVIKKLVFDEKKVTMSELSKALQTNWEGYEVLRQTCINKVPKYGNDDPIADEITQEIIDLVSNETQKIKDINGGSWNILAQSVSIYKATSALTGAMPDGKKAGHPVADGGVSPDHGTDKNGAFSVLRSDSKINHLNTKGLLLNQWFSPELLEGEQGLNWMKAYLKMWYDYGISQIQINVMDPVILRKAQKKPEQYPHLTVRVSGYTANWVKLTPELQEVILERTMQITG